MHQLGPTIRCSPRARCPDLLIAKHVINSERLGTVSPFRGFHLMLIVAVDRELKRPSLVLSAQSKNLDLGDLILNAHGTSL
ncbi:hypothetical protein AAHA92_21016 [Salvia divinorum]|uniref:Uncharacterized protein n=1 Tax=Salvia divinorum TaxID=28513 RepID=A0ABD1GMG8_SALDI